jgi:ABC-type nitrate/sulfonate/bicarbonate transport system substrate-binding protein
MIDTGINRRDFTLASGAVGLGAALGMAGLFATARSAAAQARTVPIGVGLHTQGGPLVREMQSKELLERAGREMGLDLRAEYQDYQILLRMQQAVAAGQLQFAMFGNTPNIRMLATSRPTIPIALAGGTTEFHVQVAPNSSIKTFDDIRGKTILTIAGSDVHVMLLIMLRSRFGTDDLRQLGITLRGINAVTELWIQQPGVDVTIGFPPGSLDAEYAGQFRTLIYNNGRTGPAYDGPEGRGEGHQLSWFRNSPFYPEAFFPPRIWWAVREEFLNQNPQIVTAFLAAQQRAAAFIKQAGAQYAVGLIGEHWAGSVRAKLREVETILWFKRGWVWITEGDARALIGLSQVRQIFENPLDGARIKGLMGRAADVTRRAYEIAGRIPDTPVFTDPNATDQRGLPQWEAERWTMQA